MKRGVDEHLQPEGASKNSCPTIGCRTLGSSMTNQVAALETRSWIYVKLYRKHEGGDAWKRQLDWYHEVLRGLVKPWVSSHAQIAFVVFGIYGPRDYET